MTFNQVQVSQVFSKTTHYEDQNIKEEYLTVHDYCKIQQVYSQDKYYQPSKTQEYTY